MRWQRILRVVIALAGFGVAAAVYLNTRERPAPARPVLSTETDQTAKMQSGAGEQVRYDGNRLLGTLTYSEFRTYENDRHVWRDFHYTLEDGTVLSAEHVEARGKAAGGDMPDELTLKRKVHLRTKDGTTLSGDSGTYREGTGQARIPGPTTFARGRMSGTGIGGEYDRKTGIFKLLKDAKVRIEPEHEGDTPLDASGASMTFTRDARSVLFDQNARLERAAETMTGAQATLYMSEDESRFRAIELRGNSRITPAANQPSALPEMQAGDIDLGFYEGSTSLERGALRGNATMVQRGDGGTQSIEAPQIDFGTAPDGRTLTRLQTAGNRAVVRTPAATGRAARTITASTLVATGDDKNGLTAALFDEKVEFVETGGSGRGAASDSRRVATASRLRMVLKGRLDNIEQARFERDVVFTSAGMKGYGDVGVYRASASELDLLPDPKMPRRRVTVDDQEAGVRVESGGQITVYLDSNDLRAQRDVTTVTSGAKGKKPATTTAIFNDSDPIYGSSTDFTYDHGARTATYVGTPAVSARLKQGENIVSGLEVVFLRERQDLRAKGKVDTTFEMTTTARDGAKPAAPVNYRITADSLVYTESIRTARYVGAVTLRSKDVETTAATLDLLLAKEARALDRLEATGNVRTVMEGGREARGDRLEYEAAADLYKLWGKPLTLIDKDRDGACYGQDGSFVRFEGKLGAPDFPADQNADGGAPRRPIACPSPAR